MVNTEIRLIIFFAAKDGEALYSQQKQDQELAVAQIMNFLLQNSDFRYDLNQIPYNYTVEVTNKFKGLDLIDRGPEELWTEACNIVQEAVIKTITKKKKCRKAKWLSGAALQIVEKKKEKWKTKEKRKDISIWNRKAKNSKEK